MCGIFGIITNDKQKRIGTNLESLYRLSESRGMEASGFFSLTDSVVTLFKSPEKGSNIIKTTQFKSISGYKNKPYQVFVGHSRLATNGSNKDNQNNQPIHRDEVLCVHNGIIVNVEAIWERYSLLKREYDVDTEIIPALFHQYMRKQNSPMKATRHVFKKIIGAATICIAPTQANYLILATNTGSLYYTQEKNQMVFASEEYTLRKRNFQKISHLSAGWGALVSYDPITLQLFSIKQPSKPIIRSENNQRVFSDISTYPKIFQRGNQLNSMHALKKHIPDYRAISQIKRCTRCILPVSMPLIQFNDKGVCNFCSTYIPQSPAGLDMLKKYIEPFKRSDGKPDCIVPLSGGRDSSYALHFAKTILGLTPIAYTYDWGMVTDVARRNQSRLTSTLGIEHVIVSADIQKKRANIRKNVLAWLNKPDIAMVPLFMAGDKQAEYYAEELKRKTGINLILYARGNQLEDERFKFGYYGILDGTPKGVLHNLSWIGKTQMAIYFANACIKNPKYINGSLIDTAYAYASSYLMPHKDFIYLWHYIPWKENEIISTITKTYSWETADDTTTTWRIDDGTPPFYNYIYYHVQGFTEHDGLRSNQIREGHISRKEALELATEENTPRYQSLKWYFDTLGLDGNSILSRIDGMRTSY